MTTFSECGVTSRPRNTGTPIGFHPDFMFFWERDARRIADAEGYPSRATEKDVPQELKLRACEEAHHVHRAWCEAGRPDDKLTFWKAFRRSNL